MSDRKQLEILSTISLNEAQINRIKAVNRAVRVSIVKRRDGEEVSSDQWQKAEVVLTGGRKLPEVGEAPNLRWVHIPFAGVDPVLDAPILKEKKVVTTSSSGVMISQMGEYVVMALLMLGHKMPEIIRAQQERKWLMSKMLAPVELRGSTVGIVGYGSVGREVARRLHSFGATVLAAKRDVMHPEDRGYTPEGLGDPDGDYFTRLYPIEGLKGMLADCDFVLIALPLTAETRHLFNAEILAAMKPGACLINVSRGDVIDESALEHALKTGHLGGAVLDVFSQEPLPEESPLWSLDNLIITPHVSGVSNHFLDDMIDLFCENLARYIDGKPLHNVVDFEKGY